MHIVTLLFCLLSLFTGPAMAQPSAPPATQKAVLLAAFGTTDTAARAAYTTLEQEVRAALPGVEIRWAYTARNVRHIMARKQNTAMDSPATALARLGDQGATHVAVQSLHILPGHEYLWLAHTAKRFVNMPKGLQRVTVGKPLLYDTTDLQQVAQAVLRAVPKERNAQEAVIFMGHGTPHAANAFYAALQYYLWQYDPNAFVGTVENSPSLDSILATLQKNNISKAYLLPLMTVAGVHARDDMAGISPDSWKNRLAAHGITPVPVLTGLAEIPAVRAVWVTHLKKAFEALEQR